MRQYTAVQSLWMVVSGLSFALMAQCIKQALEHMGVLELVLYRSLGGVVIMVALALARHERLSLRRAAGAHFWRAVWGFSSIALFYMAIGVLAPSTAYALCFTSPLFFLILVAVVFRERLHPAAVAAVVGSFAGVLLLLRPDFSDAELVGVGGGLASGVFAALAFLMVRKLGMLGESGVRTVLSLNIYGSLFALVGLLGFGEVAGLSVAAALPVLGVIVSATVGQLALTRALHFGPSAAGAALCYSGIVFSVVMDAGLRDVGYTPADYVGFAMIVGFGAWALWLARTKSRIQVPL